MPAVSPSIGNALIQAGELQVLRLNQTFVIEGSENVWFIASGRIEIFMVQVEAGEATGPRTHFLSLEAGSLIFGMDFTRGEQDYCFLLTGHEGSELVQLRRDDLRRLPRDHEYAAMISQLVDQWLEQLSASVSRDVRPCPKTDECLFGGKPGWLPSRMSAQA